jgi:hypothetical protein
MLATVFAGFAPSYYLRGIVPAHMPFQPMSGLVMLHGLAFSAWVVLFMTQVSLVSAGRADLHRRLGMLGFGLVGLMAVLGTLAGLYGVARNSGPPIVSALSWLAVPLLDVPVFAGLICAGLANRVRPQVHKRFMLAAMIAMLPPAIGRLPWPAAMPPAVVLIGGPLPFLAVLAAWDVRSRGKLHWVTGTAAIVIVGSWLLRFAIWETPAWLAFARWVSAPFA